MFTFAAFANKNLCTSDTQKAETMINLQNPNVRKWVVIIIKVIIYALGLIATAYGLETAAAALR